MKNQSVSLHVVNARVDMCSSGHEYATADHQIDDTGLDAKDGVQCQLVTHSVCNSRLL